MTPTARSLAYCRKQGWTAGIVERWNPHSKTRHDLFGFGDLVALLPMNEGTAAPMCITIIQVTSGSNHAARRSKILALPVAEQIGEALGKIEIWSWSKKGPRGKTKRWTLRRERL